MIKNILDKEILKRNSFLEISDNKPDPLMIAKNQKTNFNILTCALFAYGNAKQIVKFLKSLDLENLTNLNEKELRKNLKDKKYRFQSNEDIIQWFLLSKKINDNDLEKIFLNGYEKENNVIDGIHELIIFLKENLNGYTSRGMNFLIGSIDSNSPLKRWNMFLRWMVRKDNIDLGLWTNIDKKDLIIPLDTHTFTIGKKYDLISRKSYDLKSAIELTESLKKFDKLDPVKYDFAIYRLGQEKKL